MRLLFAEDEADLNHILTKRLSEEGYSVDSFQNGEDALDALLLYPYDGAVLDIMMPGMDGLSILRSIRNRGIRTPVLFLTARDSVDDRVAGLDSGASDYLVKPFALDELLARLRVMMRKEGESNLLSAGDVTLNLTTRTVYRAGAEITLSAKEYALLEYFLHNKDRILSRDMIEDHIWNADYEGGTNVVDVYVRYLRRKIGENLIQTVRGRGYVLRDPQNGDHP